VQLREDIEELLMFIYLTNIESILFIILLFNYFITILHRSLFFNLKRHLFLCVFILLLSILL